MANFNNYDPASFGWSRNPDLVPYSFHGVNFGQVARAAKPVFDALLTELVPHIEGGLVAGKCWGYSATDDLPDGSWSFHHYGLAIDVNWNVNHMGNDIPDATGLYAIPRAVAASIATKYGCEWGGDWLDGFHDNMHFEVHLSPAEASAVTGSTPLIATPTDWFDMATAQDLDAAIARAIPAIVDAVWTRRLLDQDGKTNSVGTAGQCLRDTRKIAAGVRDSVNAQGKATP